MRKKHLAFAAMLLAALQVFGTTAAAAGTKSSKAAPDWDNYIRKINEIYKGSSDPEEREKKMHEAEDELMNTWAVIPIYYYNDPYMLKSDCDGLYSNEFGFKFFHKMTTPDGTLNANMSSEPDALDPALNRSVDGACLTILAFSGLYTYNEEDELVPELSDGEPEVSDDGLTYTFKLKDGLTWSDGETLDAEDFVYSWNRLANPDTAAGYSYLCDSANIGRKKDGTLDIEASDDGSTFTVHLTEPCVYFIDLCAFPVFFPVPEQAVTKADPDGKNPGAWALESGFVTSGPMTCTAWKHNESMTYEKNPNYWDADNVTLDTVNFMLSADDSATFNAYSDGSLQYIDNIPADEISSAADSEEFHIAPCLGTYYVCFNVNSPLFKGKTPEQAAAMRQAFSVLIDRQYIVDVIGQTGQQPAGTYIPAGMSDGHGGVFAENDDDYEYPVTWDFDGKEAVGYYDPTQTGAGNVEEAIALLEEAGFEFDDSGMLSASTPITVEYLTNEGTGNQQIAESIQQDLAIIGINMDIKSEEWNVFLNDRKNGQFDFAREGWYADYNDPVNMLEVWLPDSGNNDAQFGR